MVFHSRLSNNKFPQVSRTLLSILAVLNNAEVSQSLSCSIVFFSSLARSRYLSLFLLSFFFFILWSTWIAMFTIWQVLLVFFFFFFFYYHLIWSSGRDWESRLYLKIPEKFVRLILQDGFWVVYTPLVRMVNLIFLHNSQWITSPLSLF